MILARYVILLHGPVEAPAEEGSAERWRERDARVLADLPAMLEEAEENLNDMLPPGYSVSIVEKR